MLDTVAITGPTDEQVIGIPFHPPIKCSIPAWPCARYASLTLGGNEFSADGLLPISGAFQSHYVVHAVSGVELQINKIALAVEQRPEALLDPEPELRRLQIALELVGGLLSHWAQGPA